MLLSRPLKENFENMFASRNYSFFPYNAALSRRPPPTGTTWFCLVSLRLSGPETSGIQIVRSSLYVYFVCLNSLSGISNSWLGIPSPWRRGLRRQCKQHSVVCVSWCIVQWVDRWNFIGIGMTNDDDKSVPSTDADPKQRESCVPYFDALWFCYCTSKLSSFSFSTWVILNHAWH